MLAVVVVGLAGAGAGVWFVQHEPTVEAPRDLKAKSVSSTRAILSWNGDEDAESYIVTVGSNRTLTQDVQTIRSRTTKVTVNDSLTPTSTGERYFRVKAVESDRSAVSGARRFALRPGPAGAVKVQKTSASGVRVAWKPVRNAAAFDVLISRDKAFTQRVLAARTLDASGKLVAGDLRPATKYWIKFRPVNSEHDGAFSRATSFATEPTEVSFRVANWNVCSEVCSGYESRGRAGAAFLNANKVDLFGLQEAGGIRVGAITKRLWSGGTQGFRVAAGGRKTRYIFYRPALFTQTDAGNIPLSPEKWATWATFRVKATGRQFIYVNIHLKNGKGNDPRRGREITNAINGINALNTDNLPVIYAGDFNSGLHRAQDSPGRIIKAAGLTDSITMAKNVVNGRVNTIHDFAPSIPAGGVMIDHIYVSDGWVVPEWNQLVRSSGGRYITPLVSDHNALSAVVSLDAAKINLGKTTVTAAIPGLAANASPRK